MEVNLPKKYFTNCTALKSCLRHYTSQIQHFLVSLFSSVRTSNNEGCTRFVEPAGCFGLDKRRRQEGPGSCLNWYVLTFWPAVLSFIFLVLFTFRHAYGLGLFPEMSCLTELS